MTLAFAKSIGFLSAHLNKIFLPVFIFFFQYSFSQSIVINEVSQGPSGSKEYVEFLVTGPALVNCTDTPSCIDLRNYVFDDNNGYLNGAPTGGVGIASGACRFSNDIFWSCIPAGTIIVVYNDSDLNPSIPAQDIDMADGNCFLNIPISSVLFERHNTLPSSSDMTYATIGWISGGSWTPISMANAQDGFQIYAPANLITPVFSIGWGAVNTLGDIYMGAGSASGDVFYANDCNYFSQASWVTGPASSDETPGNTNAGQSACVGQMNHNCNPPTVVVTPVAETCASLCDGSASAVVTGGTAPFSFSWSPPPGAGAGTANISGLCDAIYTLTLTDNNGAGCILTTTTTINPGLSCCPMTNTEAFTNVTCVGANDGTISLTENAGVAPVTYSIDGGVTIQLSGNFANLVPGSYNVLIEDGGGCQYLSVILISDGPAGAVPTFNPVASICSGDFLNNLPIISLNAFSGAWSPVTDNTATTTYTFTPNAGQCATTTTLIIVVNPIYNLSENTAACENSTFTFHDGTSQLIVGNVSHVSNLTGLGGCDSIITTNVTMNSVYNSVENITVCENTNVTFPDGTSQVINSSFAHASNLLTANGCDSVIVTNVTMNPIFSITENITVCEGSDYTFPDGTTHFAIMTSESYISNLLTLSGCDSLITTNIAVNVAASSIENIFVCSGNNYTFPDGTTQLSILINTTYISSLFSVAGCDSLVTTNLQVTPVYNLVVNNAACENSNFTFPDGTTQLINANLSHTSNLITVNGCDSIIITNVTMNPIYNFVENISVCQNTNVTFPDGTTHLIISSTSHISNLLMTTGCDSIIVTNVVTNSAYSSVQNSEICSGDSYTFPDGITHNSIFIDEVYVASFTSISGCDSLIVTNIIVNPLPTVFAGVDQGACQNANVTLTATGAQTYLWTGGVTNGIPFLPANAQETFIVTGTDNNGCSNSDNLDVNVYAFPSVNFTANVLSGCDPLTVQFDNLTSNGQNCVWDFGDGNTEVGCGTVSNTFTSSGFYSISLNVTDVNGCQSSLNLLDSIQVFPSPVASFTADNYLLDAFDSEVNFTNNSTFADWYSWDFGDVSGQVSNENPSHEFPSNQSNTNYTVNLVAGNNLNCTDTAQINIIVQDIILFYVPNVFTPDGDEFNELFQPVFVSGFDPYDFHLMIFNRWGELVFESYNAAVGWNGTYADGPLVEDGVYIWKIDFRETMSDKRHEYYGQVTVLK